MREFFKGWRRKVGVFTLVISLILTAGWVMSHRSMIEIHLLGAHFESDFGTVTFVVNLPTSGYVSRLWYWSVDYWSAVIPLASLSAYLILWKPCKRTELPHA